MDHRIEPEVKADVPEVKEAKEDELKKNLGSMECL